MPRVTRAQAEAALAIIRQCLLVSDAPCEVYQDAVLSLRAYFAQQPDDDEVTVGSRMIAEERWRQTYAEGYSTEHDDAHEEGEIGDAAIAYILSANGAEDEAELYWPWVRDSFGPKSKVADLVRAGALVAAELDRQLRLAALPPLPEKEDAR